MIKSRSEGGRARLVGGGALVIVTIIVVAVGLNWDRSRTEQVSTSGPATTLDLSSEASRPTTIERDPSTPLKVNFIGTDITRGYFANSESSTYKSLMVTNLQTTGPVESVFTDRTDTDPAIPDAPDSTADGSSIVVLELGTVDADRKVAIEPFSVRYGTLLDEIRQRSPDALIICAGTWQPMSFGHNYDFAIETQCLARQGKYRSLVDLYADEKNRGPAGLDTFGGTSDTVHPNDAGQRAIAERLMGSYTISAD